MTGKAEFEALIRGLLRVGSNEALAASGLLAGSADAAAITRELDPLRRAPALAVAEVRANGVRGDVRIHSGDGRAWLVVLWVDQSRVPTLISLTVYERPESFRADGASFVIVVNGPSSVGKSALMTAFADAATTPWARVDEPMFGRLPNRYLAWPATAGPVADGFLAALAAAARRGNQFIVSTGGITQDRFREALAGVPTCYVGLNAPLSVLIERQLTQADKYGGLAEESVGIHAGWEYDLTIDTAEHRPAEAAARLAEFIAR